MASAMDEGKGSLAIPLAKMMMSTKTSLCDRFQKLTPAKKELDFDLEHDDGLEPSAPKAPAAQARRSLGLGLGAGLGQGPLKNEQLQLQLALQYARRQQMQKHRIMAQAQAQARLEYEAQAEMFAAESEDFAFGFPPGSVYGHGFGGFPGYQRGGNARLTEALMQSRMAGNSSSAAIALARAPAVRGRFGPPRARINAGLGGIRKMPGGIAKPITGPSNRHTPFGNGGSRPNRNKNGSGTGNLMPIRKRGGDVLGGGKSFQKDDVTKEQLDDDLDDYMSKAKGKSKGALDKELDSYMAEKAKVTAAAIEEKILADEPEEEDEEAKNKMEMEISEIYENLD